MMDNKTAKNVGFIILMASLGTGLILSALTGVIKAKKGK